MKITKILSAVAAAAVATTTLATVASATLTAPTAPDAGLSAGTGSWLVQLFNVGNPDENKPATDYGIDYSAVAAVEVTFVAAEPDWWDGQTGGGVIYSVNGGDIASGTALWDTYNWPSTWQYWGVVDEALEINTQDANQGVLSEKVGEYTYKLHADIVNPLVVEDSVNEIGCMQIGMQEWGSSMSELTVIGCDVLDASGNVMVSFDANGVATVAAAGGAVDTDAPVAGGDKTSPDTGVEGVAAVAGLAVVAAGAVVLSKKRK